MKVALLTATVSRLAGGLFVSVRRLAQALGDKGDIDISVLALRDRHTDADLASWRPIVPQVSDPRGPRAFGYSPALRRQLDQTRADLAHVHGLWMYPSLACLNWHRRSNRPFLISPRGMLDPWALATSRWKKKLAGRLYEQAHLHSATCLHALCESEAEAIRAFGLTNPIAIIPNGIDLPGRCFAGAVFQWGGVSEGRKVLLYLGRIHPKKGLVNLLKAWQRTLNSKLSTLNPWVLAIAGWDQGGHEAELKRLATELGIPWADVRESGEQGAEGREETAELAGGRLGNTEMLKGESTRSRMPEAHFSVSASQRFSVLFLGPQFGEDKAACYRACDAFILPSFSEGLPMVVLEAWAYGKPLLMTPQCNLPEGFAAGAALRVEASVESVAQALEELFRFPDTALRAMGEKGRALVATNYSWPLIATEMRQVYGWMLGGGTKPGCVV